MYVFTDSLLADVANCSFPYTYNGGLYYECLADRIELLVCGCLGEDYKPVACDSCPGITSVVSLKSVVILCSGGGSIYTLEPV